MGRGKRKPPQPRVPRGSAQQAGSRRRKGARDRLILTVLLVVIAGLLVVLITMLPEQLPGRSRESQAGETGTHGTSGGAAAEPDHGVEPGPDAGGAPTEYYPEDEQVPETAAQSTDEEHWWLPDPPSADASPGRLYFVLDDAGNSLDTLDQFLSLPMPLTIAVLPQRAYSVETALLVSAAGKEVILHQPMEAMNGANPGAGEISSELSDSVITETIDVNLNSVPGAAGLNNHMGSRATQDERVMELVMQEAKRRGLYFLDSRTTSDSVAARVARRVGLSFAERNVFLDNVHTRDEILRALSGALQLAYERASVVVIGHVTVPLVAELLAEVYPVLVERGFTFGLLSDLMR